MGTKTWTNVQVAMQTVLAPAKTITAITKAGTIGDRPQLIHDGYKA